MAVKAIIGFEHLPPSVPQSVWSPFLGPLFANEASDTATIVNGWVTPQGTATTIPEGLYLKHFAACAAPANLVYIGMRVRVDVLDANHTLMYGPNLGSVIFYMSEIPSVKVGGIYYLEVEINLTTGATRRWVDDVAISNGPSLSSYIAAMKAGTAQSIVGILTRGYAKTQRASLRDIYISNDVASADGGPTGRLGPRQVYPVLLDKAQGTGWAASDASELLPALKKGLGTSGKATLSSPSSKAPLTVGLLLDGLKDTVPININAVELSVANKSNDGATSSLTKLSLNGTDKATASVPAPTTISYGTSLGVVHKAPDGAAWTISKLNASEAVITPDTVG